MANLTHANHYRHRNRQLSLDFSEIDVAAYYGHRVPELPQMGDEWQGPCPIHCGHGPNFVVEGATGRWFCHSECGRGGDILDLEQLLTGDDFKRARDRVLDVIAWHAQTERPSQVTASDGCELVISAATEPWRTIAEYDYTDGNGTIPFQVVRSERASSVGREKMFVQRRRDGGGQWQYNLKGIKRVPYRLPRLLQSDTVYIVEGEKDVETLESRGLVGSCNPGGSGNSSLFQELEFKECFRGRNVRIIPDNDAPGWKHAVAAGDALVEIAASRPHHRIT